MMTFQQYLNYYYGISQHEFNFSLEVAEQNALFDEYDLYQAFEGEKDAERVDQLLSALNR